MAEPGDTIKCRNCGYEVPVGNFCVRCGDSLQDELSAVTGHPSRGFGAAPNESRFLPSIVSTIFPHLPRTDMDSFRVALAAGAVTIVILGLVRLFPLALVGCAVLVPLLVLLYLWDVDLYEDEPPRVIGFTVAWGIALGVGVGFLSKAVAEANTGLALQTTTHTLVWRGILLPAISFACMVAGPLILLPYRKFNDVLDGATFGGATAPSSSAPSC